MEKQVFFFHSDFTWNQFWSFCSSKNCHFYHMMSSEFWIFGCFSRFQVWIFQKIKIDEMTVVDPLKSAKTDFTWNQSGYCGTSTLHSQNSQLGCPDLYCNTVQTYFSGMSLTCTSWSRKKANFILTYRFQTLDFQCDWLVTINQYFEWNWYTDS